MSNTGERVFLCVSVFTGFTPLKTCSGTRLMTAKGSLLSEDRKKAYFKGVHDTHVRTVWMCDSVVVIVVVIVEV